MKHVFARISKVLFYLAYQIKIKAVYHGLVLCNPSYWRRWEASV